MQMIMFQAILFLLVGTHYEIMNFLIEMHYYQKLVFKWERYLIYLLIEKPSFRVAILYLN